MNIYKRQKLFVVAISLIAGSISAQTETEEAQPSIVDDSKVEKIKVVGSRIKRIDIETSAPVQIIDREQIEASGVVSLGELIRKNAGASPSGNFSGSSNFVASGSSTVNLLGLGASRTLVLLNGKRLPVTAGLDAVNVDNIPIALIETVEILSGGASDVYGADAVGGVINIKLKKDLEGSEVAVFSTFPAKPGGEELEIAVSNGGGGSQTRFLTFFPAGFEHEDLLINETETLITTKLEKNLL